MSHYVSYNQLSSPYQAFLGALSATSEPKSFREASKDSRWVDAMSVEI